MNKPFSITLVAGIVGLASSLSGTRCHDYSALGIVVPTPSDSVIRDTNIRQSTDSPGALESLCWRRTGSMPETAIAGNKDSKKPSPPPPPPKKN
ncbi:MAG TPA: hypothetical protein VG797_03475 [Phycisphaerales bacterium]|nr:hypothetical protein [Phycisphaerales bacterium]